MTIKDIALLFGFRYLNAAPRFVFMKALKEKRYILQCSIFVECKTDLGRNKTTIEQRVTNSTIVIKIWKFVFCRSAYNYLVSCSVITENSKEYSEVLLIKASFYTRDSLSAKNSDVNKCKHQNQVIPNDPNCHVWINAFPAFKCILQEEMAATDVMELLEQRRVNVLCTEWYTPRSYYHCAMARLFVNLTFKS